MQRLTCVLRFYLSLYLPFSIFSLSLSLLSASPGLRDQESVTDRTGAAVVEPVYRLLDFVRKRRRPLLSTVSCHLAGL
jgi:hypothetical protein